MPRRLASGAATLRPTSEQFRAYEAMFDYFNRKLWDGRLPPVLLNFSRARRAGGFFAAERWQTRGTAKVRTKMPEISINPGFLLTRTPREIASTLVHEMVHHWQREFGSPSRAGYHNREWAAEMKRVGLQPSSTGEPGGAETGQSMTHYVVEGGPYARAFNALPKSCVLPWRCQPSFETARNKVKYTCAGCGVSVWGKAGLAVMCASATHRHNSHRMTPATMPR